MQVSVNQLYEWTGFDRRTIKRRIEAVKPDSVGRYSSSAALEAIYTGGSGGEDGDISSFEAVRRLNIKRAEEIALDMEIKSGKRIPVDVCEQVDDEVYQSVAAVLKSKKGKKL